MPGVFTKKSVIVFCFCCFALFATSSLSFADVTCTVKPVTVTMTPPNDTSPRSGVKVILKNSTGATIPNTNWANGTNRVFYIYKELGDQGLAILLTALATKAQVTAAIAGTATAGSLIREIGVTQVPQ